MATIDFSYCVTAHIESCVRVRIREMRIAPGAVGVVRHAHGGEGVTADLLLVQDGVPMHPLPIKCVCH